MHFLGIGTQAVVSAGDNVVKVVKEDGGEFGDCLRLTFMHSSDVTPDGKFAVAGGFDGVLRSGMSTQSSFTHSPGKNQQKLLRKSDY